MRRGSNELLTKRIKELDIPPWPGQALFERVIVYRIPDEESARDTIGDTGLYKPEGRRDTDKARSPRGVIVSAGLRALDIMRANGMEIGELVWFAPHVPFRFVVGAGELGKDIEFYFMNVGDVIMSEDFLNRIVEKEVEIEFDRKTSQHVVTENGIAVPRVEPTHSPDES